jgi:hypothetical protein
MLDAGALVTNHAAISGLRPPRGTERIACPWPASGPDRPLQSRTAREPRQGAVLEIANIRDVDHRYAIAKSLEALHDAT